MPMEHYRPDGSLGQGYFCSTCGRQVAMYGCGSDPDCKPNPELVERLRLANPAPPRKPRFKLRMKDVL
jgi:hypothetical protein